nr:hypothetical protein GCM10020185_01090 [Pseudomonas brassicacearum subsp. brassicacearum]
MLCTPFGCTVKASTKVRHFIPELVVSSYTTTGSNPWTEMAALSSPTSGAEGGGNLITPNTQRDNLPRFKKMLMASATPEAGPPRNWPRNPATPAPAAPLRSCPTT